MEKKKTKKYEKVIYKIKSYEGQSIKFKSRSTIKISWNEACKNYSLWESIFIIIVALNKQAFFI
jgi:hypothetical protein